jgi:hypothetical protein
MIANTPAIRAMTELAETYRYDSNVANWKSVAAGVLLLLRDVLCIDEVSAALSEARSTAHS